MTRKMVPGRPVGQTMVQLICIHCGTSILRRAGQHSRNVRLKRDGPYCSKSCAKFARPKAEPKVLVPDEFWDRVGIYALADDCWPWLGARQTNGYGNVVSGGRTLRAHRVAYMLVHGAIPAGMEVMHLCDNPPCCNPRHLALGSHAENMAHQWDKRGRKTPRAMASAATKMGEAIG